MLLLAGLGNPGPKYAGNRHNIGFMAVDEIVRRHAFARFRARFHALIATGVVAGRKVMAIKPLTFMNDSGRAVGAAMRFYRLAPADLVVIHDDLDLKPGKLKVKRGGGHAGHKGLESLDAHIGTDYWRVRVGIGHPGDKRLVEAYVLKDFAKEEQAPIRRLVEAIAEAWPCFVAGDENQFMNKVVWLTGPPKPRRAPPAAGAPGSG
ncbi:MAG: aminoacyl-tRNA hydrolase [Kiloniellales bacterium]